MIRLDTVVALAAVLVPDAAVRLASCLERRAADDVARALEVQVERSRVDRAAALAAALRDPPSGAAARPSESQRVLDRAWRDLASWSRARATRPCRSEPTHTPIRDRSVSGRHGN